MQFGAAAHASRWTSASSRGPSGRVSLEHAVRTDGDAAEVGWEMAGKVLVRLGVLSSVLVAALLWCPIGQGQASASPGTGYWLEAGDGGVFAFGSAAFLGSATERCTMQCFGFGATADGQGYWVVDNYPATDAGGTNLYGYGSAFDVHVPGTSSGGATAVASTPSSKGGWILYGMTGTVVPFGDASWFGDGTGITQCCGSWPPFGSAIDYFSGIASTPDGGGYWLVGIDGGVFAYGNATFYGSMGNHRPNEPVDGIARTNDGRGYWLVSYDGGVFAFGDAAFSGSMGGQPLNSIMIGIAANPDGTGYWTVAQDGGVFAFGDAPFLGSLGGQFIARPVYGIAPSG